MFWTRTSWLTLGTLNHLTRSFSRITLTSTCNAGGAGPHFLTSNSNPDPNLNRSTSISCIQTRNKSTKVRRTHPRRSWPVRKRERHDEELTSDNKDFIKQVVLDEFGPPSIPESTGMPYVSPLKNFVHARGTPKPSSIRTGVIARKIGIYPIWDKDGKRSLMTLLQVVDNHVVRVVTPGKCQSHYSEKNPHLGRLIVGAESADPQIFTKEYCGLFQDSGVLPKIKLARFKVSWEAALQVGTPLYATHFKVGQLVDVFGTTIDRGFQGVMVRWGFHGMPATHGVTKSHRRGGNTGGGGEKGRIWPGTKLPGHMGNRRRWLRGQEVVRINTKYNVIFVKGPAIPGEVNSFVQIRDTFNERNKKLDLPFPTHYPDELEEPLPDDIFHPNYHNFVDPTVTFEETK